MLEKSKISKIKKAFLPLLFLGMMTSCGKNNNPILKDAAIHEDPKFGSATVEISIDSFNNLGFKLGDSCNISFSNGYKIDDVPYFNGYYVKNNMPVIVSYPSSENVVITYNNAGIWSVASLKDTDTVTITLNESGKYLATQEALGQSYSLDVNDYPSVEAFSNFRSLKGGNLKENFLYRGASPVDNSRNRAKSTDNLLKEKSINSIMDLADSDDDIKGYIAKEDFSSDYTKQLYEDGKISLLAMGSSYTSATYKQSVVKGFRHMLNTEGPYYIHCMEGKDRTGFVCALIEALASSTYDEMCLDYMTTYKNYYKITLEDMPEKYNAVVSLYFDSFMECLHGTSDVETLKKADYTSDAKSYLKDGGMSDEEIESFIKLISK